MVRRHTIPAAKTSSLIDLIARTRLRAERLESRDTPSTVVPEEVYSLPQLPGMNTYPTDIQPAVVERPLLQQVRGRYAVGTNGGGVAQVNVYDAPTGALLGIINPFGRFTGGVTVATGDVTGDGIEDVIVGSGRWRQPTVKVFDGATLRELASFNAYSSTFNGGVTVAVGDVDGDKRADIVTGSGVGSMPHIKAFSGKELFPTHAPAATSTPTAIRNFLALDRSFRGGVNVAAGDVNGDGLADIAVGRMAGSAEVTVYSGAKSGGVLFTLPSTAATSGATLAIGDVTGDGRAEVITGSAALNKSTVRVYDATGREVAAHAAFLGNGGVNVAVADIDGDGKKELIAGSGPNTPVGVKIMSLDGQMKRQFPAVLPWFRGGLSVG